MSVLLLPGRARQAVEVTVGFFPPLSGSALRAREPLRGGPRANGASGPPAGSTVSFLSARQ